MTDRWGCNRIAESLLKSEQHCVNPVRTMVECVLQGQFGREGNEWVREFVGKLSTIPEHVDPSVDTRALTDKCVKFSGELRKCLGSVGVPTELHTSAHSEVANHVYLVCHIACSEILIDPTIGQFLVGYNHVFVGTREELADLVVNKARYGCQYKIRQMVTGETETDFFERMWGHVSRLYNTAKESNNSIKLEKLNYDEHDCQQYFTSLRINCLKMDYICR